jgi:hypothetical protein
MYFVVLVKSRIGISHFSRKMNDRNLIVIFHGSYKKSKACIQKTNVFFHR